MTLRDIVRGFSGRRIVVLGDLGVDCYVETRPTRLSREAPVMILRYERRRYQPGCAANTVMNLCALGAEVLPIGVVGDDEPGRSLVDAFREAGIPTEGLVTTGRSVVKIRLMSGDYSRPQQQIIRVDLEPDDPQEEDTVQELVGRGSVAEGAEGIVVSDYGYAAASPDLLRAVRAAAPDALLCVDTRDNLGGFEEVDMLTPNEWEAGEYLGYSVVTDEDAEQAARELVERTEASAILLTRGNHGMVLCDGARVHRLPVAGSKEIVDPSGAGDTVVAAAALARVAGATYLQAARIANHAAGISVMKSGAQPVSIRELREALAGG